MSHDVVTTAKVPKKVPPVMFSYIIQPLIASSSVFELIISILVVQF